MTLQNYQEKIIRQFESQERLLAELYGVFADRFPVDQSFWQGLSREETMHAKIVTALHTGVKKGLLVFDEGKVKTYTLTAMIERTRGLLETARQGGMDRVAALAQAVDLESALIEKGVFSRFEPLTEKARATLKRLNSETLSHVSRVRQVRDTAMRARNEPRPAPKRPPTAREERITWTPDLSVGNPVLDDQHRLFFALVNDLTALRAAGGGSGALLDLLRRMIAFADAHFAAEDEVMIESDFPLFASHRQEHQRFMQQVQHFVQAFDQGQEGLMDEMAAFMRTWWYRHTAESDRRYARWIRSRRMD